MDRKKTLSIQPQPTKQYSASLTFYIDNILDSIHSVINTMATALPSGDKAPVVSFCEPQTTVTIYITAQKSSDSQEKVARGPLPSPANSSGSLTTQTTSEPETPKFVIHKHLICHHSPFFSAAFNSNFEEGITQEMTIDMDLNAFGLFVNWLYNQVILDASGEQPDLPTLAHLWIFADRVLIPQLQNQAMDIMYSRLLSGGSVVRQEFCSFCNIADEHADGDNYLTELAAALLTWEHPNFILNIDPNMVPASVFAKSWASLKILQGLGSGQPATLVAFHVKEDAN
jgi:hypothetical protein